MLAPTFCENLRAMQQMCHCTDNAIKSRRVHSKAWVSCKITVLENLCVVCQLGARFPRSTLAVVSLCLTQYVPAIDEESTLY